MPAQDMTVELFYDGAWHDITADDDVFTEPIVIKRGQSDEATQLRPAAITMQLANDDDKYRTSNPVSPLYGKAGRNTPTRVSVGAKVRGVVEASAWEADQTRDFRRFPKRGKAWVDFEGGGLLQRIGQWTEPLRSPFYTYNTTELTDLVGYWPMEDPRGTQRPAFTPVAGAENTYLLGVGFDSQQRPPGSGPLADQLLQGGAVFKFVSGDPQSTVGWQYSSLAYMTELGGSFWTPVQIELANGTYIFFNLDDGSSQTNLLASDVTVTTLFSSTNGYPSGFTWSGKWIMFTCQGSYSGGTTTIDFYYRAIDEADTWHVSGTFSGVPSSLNRCFCAGMPDGSAFGHVIGVANTGLQLTNADRFTALRGHAGETAADRFERLCQLRNISYTIIGTNADSSAMGAQGVDSFPNQLKEIQSTEDALIFDDIDTIGLVLMLRGARQNQTPALELSPSDLPALPREVTDDLDTHNIVTASQRDGADVTASDDTGPLGTQPPPDGVGEAKQTVDVNVYDPDNDLPQEANWWLRRGTVNLPRFPQVTVNLGALDADKVAEVEGVEVGSVITLTGFREYLIRLYVLGWTETIRPADGGKVRRTITFICAPDQQFNVGVLDTNRLQAKYTTLSDSLSPSATTLVLAISSALEQWRTGASTAHVLIAGEEIALGTIAAVTGTGPWTQTVTGCARSVNGIVKTHAAGEPVTVKDAIRLTLRRAS